MKHPRSFWAAFFIVGGVVDIWADRNRHPGDTLSEVARDFFRTDTPVGKVRFLTAWSLLSAWLVPHICKATKNTLSS